MYSKNFYSVETVLTLPHFDELKKKITVLTYFIYGFSLLIIIIIPGFFKGLFCNIVHIVFYLFFMITNTPVMLIPES